MFWFKNVVDEVLWHKREGDEKQLQIWQSMASGFLATCPGMVLTNPFDIAKVNEKRLVHLPTAFFRPAFLFSTWLNCSPLNSLLPHFSPHLPSLHPSLASPHRPAFKSKRKMPLVPLPNTVGFSKPWRSSQRKRGLSNCTEGCCLVY